MPEILAAAFLGIEHGTFLHIMLAVALTLLVLDVFANTEFLSWVSLLLFALWGTCLTEAAWQWSVLIFIGFFALACLFYYLLWSRCVRPLVMNLIMRNAPQESTEQAAGKSATVLGEGDNLCIRWDDLVIPIEEVDRPGLKAGDRVIIETIRNSEAHVRRA